MPVGPVEGDLKLVQLPCTKLIVRSHVTEMLLCLVFPIVSVKMKQNYRHFSGDAHSLPSPTMCLSQQHRLAQPPHRFRTRPSKRSSSPLINVTWVHHRVNIYEDSSGTDDETPVEQSGYSKVNLIASIQNILTLVNTMKCPRCDLLGSYGFKVTKRMGLSYYISFICSCGNVIRFITGNRLERPANSQMTDLNMSNILAASLIGVQRRGW